MTDLDLMAAVKKIDKDECDGCPLLEIAAPVNNVINELVKGVQSANKGITILNMAIKERDLEIARLNNALNRHAMTALTHLN